MASFSLLIGNLPPDASEDKLVSLFQQFGQVSKFQFLDAGDSDTVRSYGYVDFVTEEGAEEARKRHNMLTFQGRVLSIQSTTTEAAFTPKMNRDLDLTLSQMKVGEKYDLLLETRLWMNSDPEGARELLAQKPILAHTLLKLFIEMKMCSIPPEVLEDRDQKTLFSTPQNAQHIEHLLRSVSSSLPATPRPPY